MAERQTPQKRKIMEYLFSTKSHPSAEMVYENIREEIPGISPATVYRNLQQLAIEGKIQRFSVGKEYRFDAETSEHVHLICRVCGRVVDMGFMGELTKKFKEKTPHKVEKVQIICHGICKDCKRGG